MKHFLFVAAIALYVVSPQAHAGLVTQNVTTTAYYPTLGNPLGSISTVVGAGVEVSCLTATAGFCANTYATPFSIDFNDTQILFNQGPVGGTGFGTTGPTAFNGFVFTGLNMGTPITGVTLSSIGFPGLDSSRVSFTSNSASINLQGLEFDSIHGFTLTLQTGAVSSVPEPSSLGLCALGLAGAVARYLKSRR